MKQTIWKPLLLGCALGLLAGIATSTGLSFLLSSSETDTAIGIYAILFLLAAALGGPLAGLSASTLTVVISARFGTPAMKEVLSDPAVLWSNIIAVGVIVSLVGFAYRLLYERLKMPGRLLLWAGTIVAFYLLLVPASIIPQYLLIGDFEVFPALLFTYKRYVPQMIFDILITSLVLIALPSAYSRPLWYRAFKFMKAGGGATR